MNIWMTWGDVFNESLTQLWFAFVQFVPSLVIAIVLFIVGCVLAALVAKALEQVFATLQVDKLLASVGADGLLRKAGMSLNSGYFVGALVKWFIIIVFLFPSLSLVGLDDVSFFLKENVLMYLQGVVMATFVLIIGTVVADAFSKTVVASAKSMEVRSAHMLGAVAKYAVWVFAFIIALGNLGLGEYMSTLFSGIIGMFAVAGALAFGLGGKDAAARFIDKVSSEVSNRG